MFGLRCRCHGLSLERAQKSCRHIPHALRMRQWICVSVGGICVSVNFLRADSSKFEFKFWSCRLFAIFVLQICLSVHTLLCRRQVWLLCLVLISYIAFSFIHFVRLVVMLCSRVRKEAPKFTDPNLISRLNLCDLCGLSVSTVLYRRYIRISTLFYLSSLY